MKIILLCVELQTKTRFFLPLSILKIKLSIYDNGTNKRLGLKS